MAASPTPSVAAAAAEATDGPVLSVVSKRLRALRKKHNRILQMEESLAAGKTLNREQEEVLRSKPVVVALIDELERLRTPLASAVAEELASRPAPAPAAADSDSSIQDLLALIYFGSLFDVKQNSEFVATMVARTHERSCCITYDYVTDDAADLLVETDLDKVSTLAALAASRPAAAAGVSHRDALQACAHHAQLWLRRAEEPIYPGSDITCEDCNRICIVVLFEFIGQWHQFYLKCASFLSRCWGESKAGQDHGVGLLHSTGNHGRGCCSGGLRW
jgi:hypothetical protein